MRHTEVTDEWLYKYIPAADEAMIRELEENTDYTYQFSARFERRMKRLMWKEAHLLFSAAYRNLKRAAVASICVIMSVFLLSLSVEGNRIKFFETVSTMLEDSVLHTYFADEPEREFRIIEPGYLPEGYKEIERHISEIHTLLIYENETGELITWEQWLISDGMSIVLDTEYDTQVTEEVKGKVVTIYFYPDEYKAAYCEYKECIYILSADNLSVDEICKIFSFMEP